MTNNLKNASVAIEKLLNDEGVHYRIRRTSDSYGQYIEVRLSDVSPMVALPLKYKMCKHENGQKDNSPDSDMVTYVHVFRTYSQSVMQEALEYVKKHENIKDLPNKYTELWQDDFYVEEKGMYATKYIMLVARGEMTAFWVEKDAQTKLE